MLHSIHCMGFKIPHKHHQLSIPLHNLFKMLEREDTSRDVQEAEGQYYWRRETRKSEG